MSASSSSIVAVFALIFWSFQLAPQAYLNHRTRSTAGLSPFLLFAWSTGSALTGVNAIAASLSPLFVIQPNLFLVFSLICYAQCYYFPPSPCLPCTPLRAIIYGLAATAWVAAVEVGVAVGFVEGGVRDASGKGLLVVNVLSLVGFVGGFAPQYAVIWREGGVRGVSRLFLAIDMTGAVLSVAALALTDDFAVVEAVSYIGVFVLDGGIVALSFLLPAPELTATSPTANGLAVEEVKDGIGALAKPESTDIQALGEPSASIPRLAP